MELVCLLVGWLVGWLVSQPASRLYRHCIESTAVMWRVKGRIVILLLYRVRGRRVPLLQSEQPCAYRALGASAERGPHERLLSADGDGTRVWRKNGLAQFRQMHRPHPVVKVTGKSSV
jgi:hypothetical protein